jgi:hypothetical protein
VTISRNGFLRIGGEENGLTLMLRCALRCDHGARFCHEKISIPIQIFYAKITPKSEANRRICSAV